MTISAQSSNPFTRSLICTYRWHRGRVEELLTPLGLHGGQELILLSLFERDGQNLTELAVGHRATSATLTKMTDRLAAAGFLKKVQDQVDQRMIRIFLTEKSRSIETNLRTMYRTLEQEMLGFLGSAERESVMQIMVRVANSLVTDRS